jgi:hypothetical protein
MIDELNRIDKVASTGDWATARMLAQKISYGMVRPDVSDSTKAEFKRFMTDFAARDPFFREAIEIISRAVEQQPGIKQSELTKTVRPEDVEAFRYVLYFGAELGKIVRIKKGSTYQLFAAKPPIEHEPN